VPDCPDCPGKEAVKRVIFCVCLVVYNGLIMCGIVVAELGCVTELQIIALNLEYGKRVITSPARPSVGHNSASAVRSSLHGHTGVQTRRLCDSFSKSFCSLIQ